uniref:C2 domain-containing protein n=1 Tax=Picea sitchensis TaxID=3332 RepID=B8LLZ8_PICSI|nr:unknown [Picea sitchensis]
MYWPRNKGKSKIQRSVLTGESSAPSFDLGAIAAGSNGTQVTCSNSSYRLTAKIIGIKDLKKPTIGSEVKSPSLKLKVEGISRRSLEITNIMDQDGVLKVNQNFTFEVRDPQSAEISIKVHGKGLFGLEDFIGACENMHVKDLLEQGTGEVELEPKWYDLYSKDLKKKLAGKIQMHIVVGTAEPEQRIRAFVGTWNIGNSSPPEDLSAWIPKGAPYEIISIGTQECDYQPRSPYTECGKDWLETCKNHIGSRYRVVHATSRGQMRLGVFVRDDAEKAVSHVHSGSEATGVGHVMANKGGVCISFKFWDTGLCFVNSHFAAHDGHCETRNSNYREIVRELRVGVQNIDLLNQFNHVFWMGDLNYRLDFTGMEENPISPQRRFWHKKVKQIMTGEYKDMLQYDELSREKSASRVLHGFNEGSINFPPTFKMQKDSTNTYSQKRMPAWCDRVLWQSLQGSEAKLLSYTHCPTISTSDHKPVSAVFALTTHALPFSNFIESRDDDGKRWHIRFTSLRANNLRASDINGYSDPYLLFVGPNVIHTSSLKLNIKHLTQFGIRLRIYQLLCSRHFLYND